MGNVIDKAFGILEEIISSSPEPCLPTPLAEKLGLNRATCSRILKQLTTHISGYNNEAFNAKIEDAYKNGTDLEARAAILHEAEDILMEDMPIVPVVFNKTFHKESKELSKIEYSYYGCAVFTKTKLKNYEDYAPKDEE